MAFHFSVPLPTPLEILDCTKFKEVSSKYFASGGQSELRLKTYEDLSSEATYQMVVKLSPSESEVLFAKKYMSDPDLYPFVMPVAHYREVILLGPPLDRLIMNRAQCDGKKFLSNLQSAFESSTLPHCEAPKMALYYVALSLAHALDDLSGQSTVHRDLRLENVLFLESGHVLLSDFGLAKFDKEYPCGVSQPGAIAPEEFRRLATPKSDVWSLGALLLRLVLDSYPLDFRESVNEGNPVFQLLKIRSNAQELFEPEGIKAPNPADGAKKNRFDPSLDPSQLQTINDIAKAMGVETFAQFALTLMKTNPDERPESEEIIASLSQLAAAQFGMPLPIDEMRNAVKEILSIPEPSGQAPEDADDFAGSLMSLLS